MAEDNETTTDEPQRPTALSNAAGARLAEDEGRLSEVQDSLQNPWTHGKASPEEQAAYHAYREKNGQMASMFTLDRSKPVGRGEGMRQTTDWRDEQARRMFRLDQGMSDQDEARSPTMESTEALYRSTEYLNHAIAQTQELDPDLAYELQLADRFLVMYPEFSVATRNGMGFAGIPEQLMAETMGLGVGELAKQADETFLRQSDIGDQFWSEFGSGLDPSTKDILTVSIAGLTPKEQRRHYALFAAYLDGRPLNSMEDQLEFANYVSQQSSMTYALENDQSGWGKFGRTLGSIFQNPADFAQDRVLGSLWTEATDPADAWYRKELQLEETMALSAGLDVGTDGWNTFTGIAGAGIDVVLDPTNVMFAGLGAMKFVRTAAIMDDAVRGGARFRNVARQFVPFGSRKAARAIGMPVGVRGRSSRILWVAMAKTQDGLIATAKQNKVFSFIHKSNSYANVIEEIPALAKAEPGVVDLLLRQPTEEAVEAVYTAALKGSYLDPQSTAHLDILATEIDMKSNLQKLLADLDPNAINAGDIAGVQGGGVYHNIPMNLADPQGAIDIVATGGKNAIAKLDDLNVGDIQDIVDITGDQAVLRRIEEYRDGTKSIANAVGDEVDAEILRIANDRRGTSTLVSDPGAWKGIKSAYQRAVDSGMELTEEAFDLGDGVMGTVRYGQSPDLGRVTGVFDEAGKLVGGRVDELAAVQHEAQGKGVYGRILELQRDKLGLTAELYAAETGPRTVDAASVGQRVFGRSAVTGSIGTAVDPLAEGVVSYINKKGTIVKALDPGSANHEKALAWVAKNTKYKNNGLTASGAIRKDALFAYMKAHNIDAVTVNGTVIFADRKQLEAAGKITKFAGGEASNSGIGAAGQRLRTASYDRRMVAPKGDAVSKWVVSDMPTKVGSVFDDILVWRRKFGVFNGKKYSEANMVQRKLRGLVAKVFLDDTPARIATGYANRQDGVRDLTRLLTQMQVDPDLVRASLDAYMESPTQATVLRILQNAGDDVGDAEISLGLMKFNAKQTSQLEYAVVNGGEQLTSGRRIDGSEGLQPLLPSQTRQYVQLPEQRAFSAHLNRARRATTRKVLPGMRNRGWGSTRKNRERLVDEFGASFTKGSENAARWDAMSMDEKMQVAYATVRPKGSTLGDGLGYGAKFGQQMSEQYGRLRNAFSVSMLAWRPIGWMGNEMLDNAWRASMADGLSFFTHPFRSVKAIYASRNIDVAMQQRKLYQAATSGVRDILKLADEPSVMLDKVAEVIPSVRKYVETAEDTKAQADAIRKFLNTELITNTDVIPVLDSPLAQALHRQRKGYQAAQKYDLPMGEAGELFDPNWDEIALTGMEQNFTTEVAASSGRWEWTLGVRRTPDLLEDYATAIGNVWARDARDPVVRLYLAQLAQTANGGEDGTYAARAFVNTGSWGVMEEPIRNMARFDGVDVENLSDLALSEWYFKNKVAPYVDDIFGDVLNNTENLTSIRQGGLVADVNGAQVIVDLDDPESVMDLIRAANGTQFKLPESVVGVVNPRSVFGYGKEADGWKTPLKSYNQWALNKFGHELPNKLQRRPAFIHAFKRYKDTYRGLGLSDDAATIVAQQKALEHVQKTFFFVEAQTPYLKKMNEIFPFFAAQYEIVKAWAWNIPASGGSFGIGHARMLRSFDHVFNSLRRNGLLQPRYDREGGVAGWDLQFAQDPHTDNLAGRTVSQMGWLAAAAPAILVEQIAEVFMEADLDLTPDEVNLKFNHPYEFLGRGGGVLPTARMQVGLNPAMGLPVSKLNDMLPIGSTSLPVAAEEATTLDVYLGDNSVTDKEQFLTANRHALIEAGIIDESEYARLQAGTLGFSTIEIPEGSSFMLPGTTLAGDFIEQLLFPYGQTDSIQEVVSDFTPRVIANMAKTIGLWINDGEEGAAMWLPNVLMGPTGRAGMGAARADAMIMLEMQTGVLTRQSEVAEKMLKVESGSPEWNVLRDEMDQIDNLITREVKEISATRGFLSTVFGVVMPFSPKMPTEAQTLREYYYQARTVSEQWAQGEPMPMPFDDRNAREAWSMVAAWAADDTGSAAKLEFLRQHGGQSSMLAAIAPRTFWGGAGLPVWEMEMTEYFERLEKGDIQPLDNDVLRFKLRSMYIQVEREMMFIEEYGNDPMVQAQAMIADGARYREISELYDEKWRALDMEDDLINDGAWAAHNEDVAGNWVDQAYNEQIEKVEAIDIVSELLEQELYPSDPQEAKRIQGELLGMKMELRAAVNVYEDERYADWEVGPRQKILNAYWDAWGEYSGLLSEQYATIDGSETGEELSAKYDAIARWRRDNDNKNIIVDGVKFASPAERSWNALDSEHKKSQADAKLSDRLEWLSWNDVAHIIEVYPEAAAYMPISTVARQIFDWKNDQDAIIARDFRIGGDLIELNEGSRKARDSRQETVNEQFEQALRDEGEFGVLEYMNNYPAENFHEFGALPKSMAWIVPYAVAVHRQLDAAEKSPLSNAGHVQQRWVLKAVQEQLASDPSARDEFVTWGMRVFQESTLEGIVAQLLGNYKGDME